jgi:putative phosphoribosyl transferase
MSAAREVDIPAVVETGALPGDLAVPEGATGLVLFAHGSGSSRLSPRNVRVAERLNAERLATVLFDLLTPGEQHDRALVFDIPLLAERLLAATAWARTELPELPLGYFGASTGAGAALWAAAEQGGGVRAVVSRGGRPDLAEPRLAEVTAPTLLIVGGEDHQVLELNRSARRAMRCQTDLQVVPGAGHLFEEPGALDRVSDLAAGWFARRLSTGP